MTAIKPLSNLRVLAAKSERYPGNKICSMPECTDPTADFHHCFPRSQIAGDSWFVVIADEDTGAYTAEPIPHVTGLCRPHHNDVEEHRAWIKLEDGVFEWYDRRQGVSTVIENEMGVVEDLPEWELVGALNPQPGSVEGKPKRKKRAKQPARAKAVYSIRVPKHEAENGYEVLDSLVDSAREKLAPELGHSDDVPAYYVIVAALALALQA